MKFELRLSTKNCIAIHAKSINEFFWMTLASITPVIFAWLFFTLRENALTFKQVILGIFLDGPIFAYVAALLAPFLFLLTKYFSGARKEKLSFGGISLVTAFFLTMISVSLFYDKQDKLIREHEVAKLNSFIVSNLNKKHIEDAKKTFYTNRSKVTKETKYSTSDWLALSCYFISLILFYYSIYIKNKDVPDLDQASRDRNTSLQETINKEFGDEQYGN